MNLKELNSLFTKALNPIYQCDEAQAIFLIAIDHILNYRRADYLLKKKEVVTEKQLKLFQEILTALETGKPIQYIIGATFFYNLSFKVNSLVLIPRPETEELVEWVLSVCSTLVNSKSKIESILDVGTGSGCIAIALKKHLPDTKMYGLDIAKDSLEIAQQNAELNNVDIKFIEQNILATPIANLRTKFSMIVSNPPYITEQEKLAMHENVLANEPHRALFVSNEQPLIFYEAICEFAKQNLSDEGYLLFEINENLGKETVNLLACKGFKNIELRKDMQGKNRMISCQKAL